MKEPAPEDFGLHPGYDWNANRLRILIIERTITCCALVFGIAVGAIADLTVAFIINLLTGYSGALLAIPMLILFYPAAAISGVWLGNLLGTSTGGKRRARERRFGGALIAWQYRSLESGPGYWQHRTSWRFISALQAFFLARGCSVEKVETADRWLADLIISIASQTFRCRCYGHTGKPISGENVRELAKVAGERSQRPVLFLRSGPWEPAIDELACSLDIPLFYEGQVMAMARSPYFMKRSARLSVFQRPGRGDLPTVLATWPIAPKLPAPVAVPIPDGWPTMVDD